MPCCAAYGCSNKKRKGEGKSFHLFPKDLDRRKEWVTRLKRADYWPSDYAVVCSDHFEESCFDRTGQTVRLKDNTVPTIFSFPEHLQTANCIKVFITSYLQTEEKVVTSRKREKMAGSLEKRIDNNPQKDECLEEDFQWEDYLEQTSTEAAPQASFLHVEQSLQSGFEEGMKLEIPNKENPNTYWVATIVMTCGPLLRMCYVGYDDDRLKEFWCDVTKTEIHHVGWSEQNKKHLLPPDNIKEKFSNWEELLEKALDGAKTVPEYLLDGDGFIAVDRITQGMKVEVQDEKSPVNLWVATILENVGGRLLLRYDTPDSMSPDIWIYYLSSRLYPLGWGERKGIPWQYRPPSVINTHHGQDEWEAIMEMSKDEARRLPLPPDLFKNDGPISEHKFKEGMKLEAIHPHNMIEICPATVTKVFYSKFFLVHIDNHCPVDKSQEAFWCCDARHPYIFPVGWARENQLQISHPQGWTTDNLEFDWDEYLQHTNSSPAPKELFSKFDLAQDMGFEVGMKLEAVNAENRNQICVATIKRILGHLLWIKLESNDSSYPSHIVSATSHDIYPAGWCESNNFPLKPPQHYKGPVRKKKLEATVPEKKEPSTEAVTCSAQKSFWCPKIFFNHKCFSGPYLSKGKLAQLPKAVGPGPVTLVLREVLSMLISVAYKSSRVLKELQCEGKPAPGMHIEVLKAKYKTNSYRASVEIATAADQVPEFCKHICTKLQCCPNLFGPELVGDHCPERCSLMSKTKFTPYIPAGKRKIGRPKGERSNMIPKPRRRKRGRKKFFTFSRLQLAEPPGELDKGQVEGEDFELGLETSSESSRASSKISPTLEKMEGLDVSAPHIKRRYRRKEFPKTEIKTRGAKIPNFALQMRMRHWTRKISISSGENANISGIPDNESLPKRRRTIAAIKPMQKSLPPLHANGDVLLKFEDLKPYLIPEIQLESNPLRWSVDDVARYLRRSEDCANLAKKIKDEEVDGQAFMLLNLPTVQEHLGLKLGPSIKLCHHIERVKYAFYTQYVK